MSTKNLARSALEGGRAKGNKEDRRFSNKKVRAKDRNYSHKASTLEEDYLDDLGATPQRSKVFKNFDDKLGGVQRWLDSKVGKNWNQSYSELRKKFDVRTTAGRHIVFDHLLNQVTKSLHTPIRYSRNYYVDEEGILREHPDSYRVMRRRRRSSTLTFKERTDWLKGRKIVDNGNDLLWMNPVTSGWLRCPHNGARICESKHVTREVLVRVTEYELLKMLAIDKKKLVKDGNGVWCRKVPMKFCLQLLGDYRQGAKLSERDLTMWSKVGDYFKDDILYKNKRWWDGKKSRR